MRARVNSSKTSLTYEELLPIISNITESIFFDTDRNYSTPQQEYILSQYFFYIDSFPKLLTLALIKCESDEQRMPIISNLWEEHGEGDLKLSHRTLYKDLLYNYKIDIPDKPKSSAIEQIITESYTYMEKCNYDEALSFLAFGIELVTPYLYKNVLKKLSLIPPNEVNFFSKHISDDEEHFIQLSKGINFVESSFLKAIEIETNFWNNITNEVEGL